MLSIKETKGISMISLVVTIVVTIILASMAVVTGTRLLKQSKNKSNETFIAVLSNAVSKRQENNTLDSSRYPYIGYLVNDETMFETVFSKKISASSSFESGTWYVIDTLIAERLGVKDSKNYIDSLEDAASDKIKIALANYLTGEVYLLELYPSELSGLVLYNDYLSSGHVHRYVQTEPTCTSPVKCADCGFILKEALGHTYEALSSPEPTVGDEKKSHYTKRCTVCGMTGGYEAHNFVFTNKSDGGVWYHNGECNKCNYSLSSNWEECTIEYEALPQTDSDTDTLHEKTCKVCGRTEMQNHQFVYMTISDTKQGANCSLCNKYIEIES